jgi:hypothetical protein
VNVCQPGPRAAPAYPGGHADIPAVTQTPTPRCAASSADVVGDRSSAAASPSVGSPPAAEPAATFGAGRRRQGGAATADDFMDALSASRVLKVTGHEAATAWRCCSRVID